MQLQSLLQFKQFYFMDFGIVNINIFLFKLNPHYLCFRNAETGLPELMVNFVTSLYKPELLKPLVEKISAIPEVVCLANSILLYYSNATSLLCL